jgi:hypothetical protein
MIKKQIVLALVLLLLIPPVLMLGGMLFSLINPDNAAGHPNYVRNYHLLALMKGTFFWASVAGAAVLWMLACLLVIRSKNRSNVWLFLASLGPLGFAVLATLNDRTAAPDRYSRFVRNLNWFVRVAYELCSFVIIGEIAYETMVLQRTLMVQFEAAATGVSTMQIINIQNASSGMWAFSEGMEVMYLAVLFYVLRPLVVRLMGHAAAAMTSPHAS